MPPADLPRLLTEAPLGAVTKAAFHQRFIQVGMAHADAAVVQAWTHMGQWFRAACAQINTGGANVNCLSVTGSAATPASPADILLWVPGALQDVNSWNVVLEWEDLVSPPMPSTPAALTSRLP